MTETGSSLTEVRQNFEAEHEDALAIFAPGDRRVFLDWLEQGSERGLESIESRVLILGLEDHQDDFSRGISKDLALIGAKLSSVGEGLGKPETRKEVRELLKQSYGAEKLKQACGEGFGQDWTDKFVFKNPDAVKTNLSGEIDQVMGKWLDSQSQSGEPAEPVERSEPPAAAEAAYKELNKKQKKLVESLAQKVTPERVEELRAAALLPGTLDLLGIRLAKELSAQDSEFYQKLPQIVIWRMGMIKERGEAKERIKTQAETLNFRLEAGRGASIIEVPIELKQLVEEAGRLDIKLPLKNLFADAAEVGSAQLGQIQILLNGELGIESSSFEYKPFKDRTGDMLGAAETLYGSKLDGGYAFVKENDKFQLKKGEEAIAEISAEEGGLIKFNWKKTTVGQGLTAMAFFGQNLNDFFAQGEKFPSMYLEFKAPAEAVPAETVAETAPAEEEMPAPLPPEEEKTAPPPVEEERVKLPDWLLALQDEEKQNQPQAKQPGEEMEAAAPASESPAPEPEPTPAPEPEALRPVQVSSTRPIETVAKTIENRGVADFEFDARSTRMLFSESLQAITQNIKVPGLTINDTGVSEFAIQAGQIQISVTANGVFKKIVNFPVSASMSFRLSSNLDLLGDPNITLPNLAPKEARGLIINQLRQIKTELSRTIVRGLLANKISSGEVDNLAVRNNSLLATIRGKVNR